MKETLFNPIKQQNRETYKTLVYSYVFVSGSDIARPRDEPRENVENILYHSHRYFYSVYDNPALSGSSKKLFDVSAFSSPSDSNYISSGDAEKIKRKTYEMMRTKLLDYDFINNKKKEFVFADDSKLTAGFVVAFSRHLFRDSIKKGSFIINIDGQNDIYDISSQFSSSANLGDYAPLTRKTGGGNIGFIYYDAGIVVLDRKFFNYKVYQPQAGINQNETYSNDEFAFFKAPQDYVLKSFINMLNYFSFEAENELQTGIFSCKIEPNDFRYSSNPTYFENGLGTRIKVKKNTQDEPISYFTTVGLYGKNNQLLAIAKVSKPIKRTKTNQNVRVRLDI